MGLVRTKGKRIWGSQKGFTLIELMVSLSIIVIVMAIAIPNFQAAAEKAQLSGCGSNQKILLGHIENYYMEKSRYPVIKVDELEKKYQEQTEDSTDSDKSDRFIDIDQRTVDGDDKSPLFHSAYHKLEDKEQWLSLDIWELKKSGYFRELVQCPRGGIYFVRLNETGRVSEIICSVHGKLIE